MRRRQAALAIPAVLALTTLVGCSGDDSEGEGDESTQASQPEEQVDCTSEVKVSGDKKAKWSKPGFAITGGELGVFYKSSQGKRSVSVYPAGEESAAYAVVTVGNKNYTTQEGEGTVEADPEGSGAKVDASATGVGAGDRVDVVASIDC